MESDDESEFAVPGEDLDVEVVEGEEVPEVPDETKPEFIRKAVREAQSLEHFLTHLPKIRTVTRVPRARYATSTVEKELSNAIYKGGGTL